MDRGIFVAASAASNLMDRLAITSHNMANVDTAGFKKVFDRLASFPAEGAARLPDARAYAVALTPGLDARPGAMTSTGDPLNVALSQDQYLTVGLPDGSRAYTRRGDAGVDSQGALRLPTGQALLGQGGEEIAIPAGFSAAVANDGTVWASDPTNPTNRQELGRLAVVSGRAPQLRDDGFYNLAEPIPAAEGSRVVSSGYIERSNVSPADAMAQMIETSRLYEMNTRLLNAFNSMDQKGSELLSGWQ
jgi:flagellar basal-body rod protein FlgF